MPRVQQSMNSNLKMCCKKSNSGLCIHACLLHASANARLWSPLSPVWKDLLKTLAAERTHADSHRRETIRVPHLWKVFLWQVKSESSPSNSCGDKSEEMIQCNVLFTRPFLSIAFKMQQCEKEFALKSYLVKHKEAGCSSSRSDVLEISRGKSQIVLRMETNSIC